MIMTKETHDVVMKEQKEELKVYHFRCDECFEQGKSSALSDFFKKHYDKKKLIPDVEEYLKAIEDDAKEEAIKEFEKKLLYGLAVKTDHSETKLFSLKDIEQLLIKFRKEELKAKLQEKTAK